MGLMRQRYKAKSCSSGLWHEGYLFKIDETYYIQSDEGGFWEKIQEETLVKCAK